MNLIACVDNNWGIGKDGNLLFRLPKDMQFFRCMTLGETVVMGGSTFRSLPGGKPLADRENLVLSARIPPGEGYLVMRTMEELLRALSDRDSSSIFIAGGESIYKAFLPFCKFAFITKVSAYGDADAFFPNLDLEPGWELLGQMGWIEDNDYRLEFTKYAQLLLLR
jgi:dihydrofolate reductase